MTPTILAFLVLLLQAPEKPPIPTVGPRDLVLEGDPVKILLPPGGIPAVMDPRLLSAAEADPVFQPDEPILGVAIGGEAVAYSLWHLDGHEIVNDVVGGTPIAATW
jgi:hypothetical protein